LQTVDSQQYTAKEIFSTI